MEVLVQARRMLASWLFCYDLCKGLKIISTSILGAHASDFGGTHLHSLFCWTPQKHASTPFRTASSALLKIARKPISRHIILSLDALFIDEIGTLSNQNFWYFGHHVSKGL